MFVFDQHFETILVVAWAVAFVALLLNLLSCWLCCCCRSFDQPRRFLALATVLVIGFALLTTLYYAIDLDQFWPAVSPRRALFNTERLQNTRVLKKLKWPSKT